ncbi:hypothetical protein DSUL_60095 [Desulfovibrionales bacterium]
MLLALRVYCYDSHYAWTYIGVILLLLNDHFFYAYAVHYFILSGG